MRKIIFAVFGLLFAPLTYGANLYLDGTEYTFSNDYGTYRGVKWAIVKSWSYSWNTLENLQVTRQINEPDTSWCKVFTVSGLPYVREAWFWTWIVFGETLRCPPWYYSGIPFWIMVNSTGSVANWYLEENALYTDTQKICFYDTYGNFGELRYYKYDDISTECPSEYNPSGTPYPKLNFYTAWTAPWPEPENPNIPWVSCKRVEVPALDNVEWFEDFFNLENSETWSGAVYNWSGQLVSRFVSADSYSNDGVDVDTFRAFDVNAFSAINTGTLAYPWGMISNIVSWAWSKNWLYTMSFASYRNVWPRYFNVMQIWWVPSGTFGKFGFMYDMGNNLTTELNYDSSGTVTFLSSKNIGDFIIKAVGGFDSLKIWTALKAVYYECSWSNGNDCELDAVNSGSWVDCRWATRWWIEYGQCWWISQNVCAPLTSSGIVVPPLALPWQIYTVNGSWQVVETPYYVPWAKIDTKSIFDCEYSDWTDTLACLKEILQNISWALTEWNEATVGANSAFNKTLQGLWSTGGSLDMWEVSNTGANVADMMFRRAWNEGVHGESFFAWLWKFILTGTLVLVVLSVMFMIAIVNKK